MKKTTENENLMNEHGEPDFEYLNSLARDGEPEALEKLQSPKVSPLKITIVKPLI